VNYRALVIILVFVTIATNASATKNVESRKSAAKQMAKELSSLGVKKIYVADFCEGPSQPSARGAFFAATFSDLLAESKKDFVVVSRADGHRFLHDKNLTDCDLVRPEVLSDFSSEFSIDALLSAVLVSDKSSYTMDFDLTNLSGKEVTHFHYTEPHDAETEALFPATASPSGWPFYFAAHDGVTTPKGVYMPFPPYPEKLRGRVSGVVLVSALVTANGHIDQVRVVQGLDPDIDRAAIDKMQSWRFLPAKSSDGSVIPVRTLFELFFRSN
jgi:TonB family protein